MIDLSLNNEVVTLDRINTFTIRLLLTGGFIIARETSGPEKNQPLPLPLLPRQRRMGNR